MTRTARENVDYWLGQATDTGYPWSGSAPKAQIGEVAAAEVALAQVHATLVVADRLAELVTAVQGLNADLADLTAVVVDSRSGRGRESRRRWFGRRRRLPATADGSTPGTPEGAAAVPSDGTPGSTSAPGGRLDSGTPAPGTTGTGGRR